MIRDEKFIESWEKERRKGKFKSILINIIIHTAIYWMVSAIAMIFLKYDFYRIKIQLYVFLAYIATYSIMLPISWNRNEERYKCLLNETIRNMK